MGSTEAPLLPDGAGRDRTPPGRGGGGALDLRQLPGRGPATTLWWTSSGSRGIPYDGTSPGTRTWRPVSWRIAATPARVDSRPSSQRGSSKWCRYDGRSGQRPAKKSPAQKELRKLCRGSPPAWVERQVLGLLNRLIQYPELITCPVLEEEPPPEAKKLRRELDGLLHRPPVDEAQAKNLAFRLAALQLDAIGPEKYENPPPSEAVPGTGTHGRTGAGIAP